MWSSFLDEYGDAVTSLNVEYMKIKNNKIKAIFLIT